MTTQTSKHFKFPLIEWKLTEADCLEFLKQRGIVNQLYDHVTRIGCWLCPYQSKRSLSYLYTNHPQYWKQLLQYESDSPQGFLAKGKRLKELEASFEVDNKFKQSVLA
jgi:3'-phosphoadenosine 5'-phosphosulfate sulfotransferase (PAPS reductase)/FAD synthetase